MGAFDWKSWFEMVLQEAISRGFFFWAAAAIVIWLAGRYLKLLEHLSNLIFGLTKSELSEAPRVGADKPGSSAFFHTFDDRACIAISRRPKRRKHRHRHRHRSLSKLS